MFLGTQIPHMISRQWISSGMIYQKETSKLASGLDSCLLKPVVRDIFFFFPALESKVPQDCILHPCRATPLGLRLVGDHLQS
jgi:hypothetical protein